MKRLEKEKNKRKLSVFEWISYILISILVVVIIVTAIIIADKKHQIDEINRRNEEISGTSISTLYQPDSIINLK